MEKNSRTVMLSGKWDFYRCCKARRSASHVNKEFRCHIKLGTLFFRDPGSLI